MFCKIWRRGGRDDNVNARGKQDMPHADAAVLLCDWREGDVDSGFDDEHVDGRVR
jgi:hypothetical protein